MKHGKKPTRQQKRIIESRCGLDPRNWLVIMDTPNRLVIIHKDQENNMRIIRKDGLDD